MTPQAAEKLIKLEIERGLSSLPEELRRWVTAHLVQPRRVEVAVDPGRPESTAVWVVTDDTGSEDSPHRVVFEERSSKFGLVCLLRDGSTWYMGPCGSFGEAVDSM